MLEFWKRKEKLTALEWGMIGFEDEEVNRPGMYLYTLYEGDICSV